MAHFCEDCGHEYDEAVLSATPVADRRCPACGSGRIGVHVKTGAVVAGAVVPTPSILTYCQPLDYVAECCHRAGAGSAEGAE